MKEVSSLPLHLKLHCKSQGMEMRWQRAAGTVTGHQGEKKLIKHKTDADLERETQAQAENGGGG